MARSKRYKLDYRTYRTMKGRGFELKCRRCGISFKIGDTVESKPTKYAPKFFHAECYDSMFIESSPEEDADLDRELEEYLKEEKENNDSKHQKHDSKEQNHDSIDKKKQQKKVTIESIEKEVEQDMQFLYMSDAETVN